MIGRHFFANSPFLPPTISVGDGRSIYVSKKSVAAIQAIARVIRENSVDFRGALPLKEMVELLSSAIGSIIVAFGARRCDRIYDPV